MIRLQQQIAHALLARGISGSVSADGWTVIVDQAHQLDAAAAMLAKYFPECIAVHHPETPSNP